MRARAPPPHPRSARGCRRARVGDRPHRASPDRLNRRERVVGDLGRGAGEPSEQRGLARVREPDQPHVGEEAEAKLDPPGLALQPALRESGCLTGRARERLFPCPPAPPCATTARCPGSVRSNRSPPSPLTSVPGGPGGRGRRRAHRGGACPPRARPGRRGSGRPGAGPRGRAAAIADEHDIAAAPPVPHRARPWARGPRGESSRSRRRRDYPRHGFLLGRTARPRG